MFGKVSDGGMPKRVLILVNDAGFFLSHRAELAMQLRNMGYIVYVSTSYSSDVTKIKALGFHYIQTPFSRSGQNIFYELYTIFHIFQLFACVKPDLVHLVTIKPVLYGGLIARMVGVGAVVVAISGLGSVFSSTKGFGRFRLKVIKLFYRLALNHRNLKVIFQNETDRNALLSLDVITYDQTSLIPGSGVKMCDYPYFPEPEGTPLVSMAARLLKEKGVCEFVGAARILKQRGVLVRMHLIGSPDPGNPSSITQSDIEAWSKEGVVDLLGYRSDIEKLYSQSNIVCLPSFYGEGLPKSLIEASACGRAIVTTDMPGCRDAVINNVTGILIPPRNEIALADAIELLIKNPDLRKKMGESGRSFAEKNFTISKVVEEHAKIYNELIQNEKN